MIIYLLWRGHEGLVTILYKVVKNTCPDSAILHESGRVGMVSYVVNESFQLLPLAWLAMALVWASSASSSVGS